MIWHLIVSRTAWILLPLALALSVGCGPSGPRVVPVSGQVRIDGEPLATGVEGFVRLIPSEGRPATGAIDPQTGNFKLTTRTPGDGVVTGTHKVQVILQQNVGQETMSLIPEKYADFDKTDLQVTVDGPTDALVIELTGPLKKPRTDAKPISTDPNID